MKKTGMDPVTRKSAAGSLLAAGNSAEIAVAWIAAGAAFEPDALAVELDRIFIARMHDAPPLPGILETLQILSRAGYLLGVASSDSEAAIRTFLKGSGMAEYIAFVTGYDTGFGPKPEPGMVHAFAEALGLAPGEIAVIGDNTHDLEMARSAGVGLAIGVLSGTSGREDLEPLADIVLGSVKDLSALIAAKGDALAD
ncbi:HAD family hydrolase [Roseibium salinum]|nr:HAD family hydrolase [Roseibium salinum]